ncbi:MAG: ATP-binding protein [Victivallales bacterium]|nr:ATP-binding protein [Victivallales bacterium]
MGKPEQGFLFKLPNDIDKLMILAAEIRELPKYKSLDRRSRYILDLAIEEMASNIIKYGYDIPGERIIEIEINFGDKDVTLTLRDDGREFNPLEANLPSKGDVHERNIGGVGVYLVRRLVSSMEYRRENERNIVTLRI